MAKAREIPGVGRDLSFALAAARVVEVRTSELLEHSRAVLDMTDTERVHDMRVATRRLRAALEVFRPCFPKGQFKAALREVKAIADALGERRDRDVTIAALEEFATALAVPDRPGVASLVEKLRTEQQEANQALAPFVAGKRLEELAQRLNELVADAERAGSPAKAAARGNGSVPDERGA